MVEKLKNLLEKYSDILIYLVVGVCTTLVNLIVFRISSSIFESNDLLPGYSTVISNVIAWIVSVLFAFGPNKIWVFRSKSWEKPVWLREFSSFITTRLASLGIETLIVWITIDLLGNKGNDVWETVWKLIANIVVIVLNYIFGKLLVFIKPKSEAQTTPASDKSTQPPKVPTDNKKLSKF